MAHAAVHQFGRLSRGGRQYNAVAEPDAAAPAGEQALVLDLGLDVPEFEQAPLGRVARWPDDRPATAAIAIAAMMGWMRIAAGERRAAHEVPHPGECPSRSRAVGASRRVGPRVRATPAPGMRLSFGR